MSFAAREANESTFRETNFRSRGAGCNTHSSESAEPHGAHSERHNSNGNGMYSDKSGISAVLDAFVPKSIYNSDTKKVFGILSAEDLLIIALIFLFAENTENRDPLLIPALIYILLSDYIDLPDLSL